MQVVTHDGIAAIVRSWERLASNVDLLRRDMIAIDF